MPFTEWWNTSAGPWHTGNNALDQWIKAMRRNAVALSLDALPDPSEAPMAPEKVIAIVVGIEYLEPHLEGGLARMLKNLGLTR
jgi:hypothetical protein